MTPSAFYALDFQQHMCWRDKDLLDALWGEGVPAVNAGYYELVCNDVQPVASIGCAWRIMAGSMELRVDLDDISSNVMLLCSHAPHRDAQSSGALILDWLCSGVRRRNLESAILRSTQADRARQA